MTRRVRDVSGNLTLRVIFVTKQYDAKRYFCYTSWENNTNNASR